MSLNIGDLIKQADKLETENNLNAALAKYKEILNICERIKDFDSANIVKRKLDIVLKKKEQQTISEKVPEKKKTFTPPQQIKFSQKVSVKTLPTSSPPNETSYRLKAEEEETPTTVFSDILGAKKLSLKPSDVKINVSKMPQNKKDLNLTQMELKGDFSSVLQYLIEQAGSNLSKNLCEKYVSELVSTLARQLTLEDLKSATEIFIKKETQA